MENQAGQRSAFSFLAAFPSQLPDEERTAVLGKAQGHSSSRHSGVPSVSQAWRKPSPSLAESHHKGGITMWLSAWPHHQPRSAAGGKQRRGCAFAVLIKAGSHAGPDEAFKGQ